MPGAGHFENAYDDKQPSTDPTDRALVSAQPRRRGGDPFSRQRRDDERYAESEAVEERENRTTQRGRVGIRGRESEDRAEGRSEARRPPEGEQESQCAGADDRHPRHVVDASFAIEPPRGPPASKEHPQQDRDGAEHDREDAFVVL